MSDVISKCNWILHIFIICCWWSFTDGCVASRGVIVVGHFAVWLVFTTLGLLSWSFTWLEWLLSSFHRLEFYCWLAFFVGICLLDEYNGFWRKKNLVASFILQNWCDTVLFIHNLHVSTHPYYWNKTVKRTTVATWSYNAIELVIIHTSNSNNVHLWMLTDLQNVT